jgi:hypothetical protein
MRKRKTYQWRPIYKIFQIFKNIPQNDILVEKHITNQIVITENDRVTHTRSVNEIGELLEVVNVSYEIKINDNWETIIRYDSHHGYLHRHLKISLTSSIELLSTAGVIKKGKPQNWFTWAIKDIQKQYINYRAGFTKRSKIPNLGY